LKLDLECNCFEIHNGNIYLMRETGSFLDDLPPFQLELERRRILDNILEGRTRVLPFHHAKDNPFGEYCIKERVLRVKKIVRMLLRGWLIDNVLDIQKLPEGVEVDT